MLKLTSTLTAALLMVPGPLGAFANEVLKVGITAPTTGSAATWGLGMDWAAKEAAKEVNAAGGVTVDGKKYTFEVITYDNKYTAAEGAKVAQTLINRDGARYIIGAIGTAPVQALQAISERNNVILFQSGWGKSLRGPTRPLTFTASSTPFEIFDPLYSFVHKKHPDAKTVAILNPNDATGKESEPVAQEVWGKLGVKIVSVNWYERGSTQFQPIAAKLAAAKADIIDLGVTPPADAAVVYQELAVLGWKGVKVVPVGTSAAQMAKIGGESSDGVYMGFSGDYAGDKATDIQRRLNEGMQKAVGEPLNPLQVGSYDAIYALKAAMEKANSLDPTVIAKTLPTITFPTSYGTTSVGGASVYGSPQQFLLPVMITQIQNGKLVELDRIWPAELKERGISVR